MKKLALASMALLLTACNSVKKNEGVDVKLERLLENPLYAEQYYDELLDRLVDLEIEKDPILTEGGKQGVVDSAQNEALIKTKEANAAQRRGTQGAFLPGKEELRGYALYLDDVLYLSPTFDSPPGPGLSIYLSAVVDPRDVTFPDESAMDLGRVESPYGAQRYDVPPVENPLLYRTVVLYDKKLGRMYGFAQMAK